jgi:lysophospholipase L1-like esterase
MVDRQFVVDDRAAYPAIVGRALGATELALAAHPGEAIAAVASRIVTLPAGADLLMINVGTNDLWTAGHDCDGEDVIERWEGLYTAARARMPRALVVVIGLRDYTVQQHRLSNDAIRAATELFNAHLLSRPGTIPVDLGQRPDAYTADHFPDSIHPSPAGARWIADAVIEAVTRGTAADS